MRQGQVEMGGGQKIPTLNNVYLPLVLRGEDDDDDNDDTFHRDPDSVTL